MIPLECSQLLLESPVVYNKNVDNKTIDFLRRLVKNLPKDSELAKKKKEFGINAFLVKDSDYEAYRNLLSEAENNGWIKELRKLQKYIKGLFKDE